MMLLKTLQKTFDLLRETFHLSFRSYESTSMGQTLFFPRLRLHEIFMKKAQLFRVFPNFQIAIVASDQAIIYNVAQILETEQQSAAYFLGLNEFKIRNLTVLSSYEKLRNKRKDIALKTTSEFAFKNIRCANSSMCVQ